MDTDREKKALSIAEQIAKLSVVALAPLEREMEIMKWPAEFRKIVWESVAGDAMTRASEAK